MASLFRKRNSYHKIDTTKNDFRADRMALVHRAAGNFPAISIGRPLNYWFNDKYENA